MFRFAGWGLLFLAACGCQSPEKRALQPIPEDAGPITYNDLLDRARGQASAAQEFFFRDSWTEVVEASVALQQTAAHLAKLKPEAIPEKHRATLAKAAQEVDDIATDLHAAARAQDVAKTNEVMQRLNLKVRELRVESPGP
jgi:hypothetical protein